jgi:predicted DNA-binding protein (UPF0251 family)
VKEVMSNTPTANCFLGADEMEACDPDGLEAFAIRNQEEVAQLLGISRQAVQQCERRALRKLRKALKKYADDWGLNDWGLNRPDAQKFESRSGGE